MYIVGTSAELITPIGNSAAAEPGAPLSSPAGDVVQLLPGSYSFTSPIGLPWGITIQGSGTDSTILNFTGDAFAFDTSYSGGYVGYVTVQDLSINTNTGGGGRAFSVRYTGSSPITNLISCTFKNLQLSCDGIAVDLDPAGARVLPY